jgi:hypothetical protein
MVPDAGENVTPSGALALQCTGAPVTDRVRTPDPPLAAEYFVGFTVATTAACFGVLGLVSGAGVVGVRGLLGGCVVGRVGCGTGRCKVVVRGCGVGVAGTLVDTTAMLVADGEGRAADVECGTDECVAEWTGRACVEVTTIAGADVVATASLDVRLVASAAAGRESGDADECSTTPPASSAATTAAAAAPRTRRRRGRVLGKPAAS